MPSTTGLSLKPGIVYGDAYAELVDHCKRHKFALPAVNVIGTHSINAVLEAAAKNGSDVILQVSNGGAAFVAGQGLADKQRAMVLGAVSMARHAALVAEQYGICIVLNTDHANRSLLGWVEGLIDLSEQERGRGRAPLFSSHMLDLSEEPLDDNLAECERVLARLTPLEMSLEIELGITGGEEDGIGSAFDEDAAENDRLYTQPEDVLQAYERLSPIGHFSVAASFGNVHGVYKPGNVRLRPEILKQSQALVSARCTPEDEAPLNLVFHGGSGSEPDKIAEAIGYGVFKMNIDTDTQFAFARAVGAYVREHQEAFEHQISPTSGHPLKKLYDPRKFIRAGELGMVERLSQAFEELGSKGKSVSSAPP